MGPTNAGCRGGGETAGCLASCRVLARQACQSTSLWHRWHPGGCARRSRGSVVAWRPGGWRWALVCTWRKATTCAHLSRARLLWPPCWRRRDSATNRCVQPPHRATGPLTAQCALTPNRSTGTRQSAAHPAKFPESSSTPNHFPL